MRTTEILVLLASVPTLEAFLSVRLTKFTGLESFGSTAARRTIHSEQEIVACLRENENWVDAKGKWHDIAPVSRRCVVYFHVAALASISVSRPSFAADGLDRKQDAVDLVGETFREIGAQLPGLGPRDVVYPSWFIGRWQMTRSLASVELLAAAQDAKELISSLPPPGQTVTYEVRFLPDGRGGAIADRGFAAEGLLPGEGRYIEL